VEKRLTVLVPDEIHREIKTRSAEYDINMKIYVFRALISQLKRDRRFEEKLEEESLS